MVIGATGMPHAQELEDILAIEQPHIAPIVIKKLEEKPWTEFQAELLAKDIATKKPAEVADSIIIGLSPEGIPADSYHTYAAANELYRGSYWHAFTHIDMIPDEKKETRDNLGKIAIEQCFDPHVYRWGDPESRHNIYGPYELLHDVVTNPKSKLKHLVSVQDLEQCIRLAFTNFVENSKEFSYSLSSQHHNTEKSQRWLYESFCEFLNHTHLLNKDFVIKTIENNPNFEPGFCTYLYLNDIFKRFEHEATNKEKAKMFWPVLKELIYPIERFDELEENKKLIGKYKKYAKSNYCKKKVEEEFKNMLKEEVCEDFWQTVSYVNGILGERKIVETLEGIARAAKGEEAKILVKNTVGHLSNYINLATVYMLKSHCTPANDDDKFDLEQKNKYMCDLDAIERRLRKTPSDPAYN